MPDFRLTRSQSGHWRGDFSAMASPCEVLIDSEDRKLAARITRTVFDEARRIETLWSRYRPGNVIDRINNSNGTRVRVDDETADMLDYAAKLWSLSDHRFDITAGVFRRVWRFDGSNRLPNPNAIRETCELVGWAKVDWTRPYLRLAPGMEIDLGGIGKEYAVDRALHRTREITEVPVLINFGGDLTCDRPRANNNPWHLGIESIGPNAAVPQIALNQGAVATSGDAQRFLLHEGVRYGHILDATTGWPAVDAPHAVTVIAQNCTLAGMLATLAMLEGRGAEAFLSSQGVRNHVQRAPRKN